jgi:hypothetical protein
VVPRVNSHTARLAPREFYSVARSNLRDGLRRCAIHGGRPVIAPIELVERVSIAAGNGFQQPTVRHPSLPIMVRGGRRGIARLYSNLLVE